MDIINITCLAAIFLPFLFGVYLLVSRLTLTCVNRNVLIFGNTLINSILLALFLFPLGFALKDNINFEYNLLSLSFGEMEFNLGFLINSNNIIFLLIAILSYLLISIYSKYYFEKKKQFLFTKQRFYAFLALIAFNTYLYLLSSNLFQLLIFWILQGCIIFIYSYFDIFKNSVNFNITRFFRINIVGDFAFLCLTLILFKYSKVLNLEIPDLNILLLQESFGDIFANADILELKICLASIIIAIISRMFIFPFNCYFSFLANSSDIFYISVSNIANLLFGTYLFFFIASFVDLFEYSLYFTIFFVISSIISLLLIIFERNIKIIFGYLVSALNGFFLAGCLLLNKNLSFLVYVLLNFILMAVFMKIAYEGKINFKTRFFTRKGKFLIERAHIFIFEKLPVKIFKVFDIIDRYFVQNIILFFVEILNIFVTLFVIKIKSKDKFNYLKAILLMIAFVLILAIFIAFFGSGGYSSEFIG